MKKIILGILIGSLLAAGTAEAGRNSFLAHWNVTVPVGDSNDFTGGLQLRGASLGWQQFYQRNAAYGISASWNVFTDNFAGTLDNGSYALTGKAWRYLNAVPLYLTWHRFQEGNRRGKAFYYGLNGGMVWIERRTEVGFYAAETSEWHPAIAPEIGLKMPWDAFLGSISLRYNVAFSTGDQDTQQWLELRFGFGMD